MKLAEAAREIERFSLPAEQTFRIKTTGRAFRILSSGLYRNKIRAIIRELSCNAFDAHVMAGCRDKPFRVHLPNALEPFFSVRDDGVGLSRDDVVNVFTVYFESPKTGTNDLIGGLGLGSKAPFSYVDSYTVTSRFNGIKTTYAAFINESGQPAIAPMSEEPTDEGNGVEVMVPVAHSKDFAEFRSEARDVLSRFEVRPEVVGCAEFTFIDHEPFLRGTGWSLPKRLIGDGYYSSMHHATALMGNVAYPITPNGLGALDERALTILSTPLDIEFPIGALDVTAGREELSYDKPTLAALEARALEIAAEAPAVIQKLFDECRTEVEARRLYGKLFGYRGIGGRLVDVGKNPPTFRGKPVTSKDFTVEMEKFEGLRLLYYYDRRSKYSRYTYMAKSSSDTLYLPCDENITIVLDDLPRGMISRINRLRMTEPTNSVLLVQRVAEDAEFDELIALLDGFKIVKGSELPKPPPAPRGKTVKVKVLNVDACNHSALHQDSWDDVEIEDIDAAEGGIYTMRRGHMAVGKNGSIDHEFLTIVQLATGLGLLGKNEKIYGLHKDALKTLSAQGEWRDFREVVTEAVTRRVTDPAIIRALANRAQITSLNSSVYYLDRNRGLLRQMARLLPEDHDLRVFVMDWGTALVSKNDLDSLILLCTMLGVHQEVPNLPPLVDRWFAIMERYPLLHVLETYRNKSFEPDHLVDYVRWIDTKEVAKAAA